MEICNYIFFSYCPLQFSYYGFSPPRHTNCRGCKLCNWCKRTGKIFCSAISSNRFSALCGSKKLILFSQAIGAHVGPLENIVISPLSVATVLSMAGVGAKGNTSLQLKKALGLTNFDTEKISKILGSLVQSMIKVHN